MDAHHLIVTHGVHASKEMREEEWIEARRVAKLKPEDVAQHSIRKGKNIKRKD
jgi:hypothetical protein